MMIEEDCLCSEQCIFYDRILRIIVGSTRCTKIAAARDKVNVESSRKAAEISLDYDQGHIAQFLTACAQALLQHLSKSSSDETSASALCDTIIALVRSVTMVSYCCLEV